MMEDPEQRKRQEKKLKLHPKSQSNFFSHFFFCWEIPIIWKKWQHKANEDDCVYTSLKEYESKKLTDKFEQLWEDEERFSIKPSLLRCIQKQFGFQYLLLGLVYAPFGIAVALLQPYFINKLLEYYTHNQKLVSRQQAYIFAGCLGLVICLRVVTIYFFVFNTTIFGMKVRIACSSLIYRRALLMKRNSIDSFTLGKIISLLLNDVTRFDHAASFLHYIWIRVLELIFGAFYLHNFFGPVALTGFTVLIYCLASLGIISLQAYKYREEVAEKTDYRIRLMNEIISGISTIKMHTWEKPFIKLVETVRKLELGKILKATNYRMFVRCYRNYLSRVCVFVPVVVAVLTNYPLTSQFVFSLISIFETYKLSVIIYVPYAAIGLGEILTSVQRIQTFLLTDYQKPNNLHTIITKKNIFCVLKLHQDLILKPVKVSIKNISVKWDSSYSTNVLEDVSLEASPGDLIGVIGSAGCGKSTLLQVILKEINCYKGQLEVNGDISYASQNAWIFSSSIRQNILFGEAFDLDKYQKVMTVCGLERDLTLFLYGDQTLVGERGVMLSGGQKARINLARVVYKKTDIVLLDDPLSAVDAHVARHIYEECISTYLKHKIVILVTHQVHFLQKATKIYQLSQGKIIKFRSYQDVLDSTNQLIDYVLKDTTVKNSVKYNNEFQKGIKEQSATIKTNLAAYWSYYLTGDRCFSFFVLLMLFLGILLTNFQNLFLTMWVNLEENPLVNSTITEFFFTTKQCLYIYSAITVSAIIINHYSFFIFTKTCIQISRVLHNKMLGKIVYQPMQFFNKYPSGQLLNRFSKDLGLIDEFLPMSLVNELTTLFSEHVLLFIVMITNIWLIFPSICLYLLIVYSVVMFLKANCNIKRTEGIARSSIFTHMLTTIEGLVTIRAHNVQDQLKRKFDNHQNTHSSSFYLLTATYSTFSFWIDIVCACYIITCIFSFFFIEENTHSSKVGFGITQVIVLCNSIQYGVTIFGELDPQMTSVERVVEYANLEPETNSGTVTPLEMWPLSGKISFDKITLKYSPDDPPVLKQASFEVLPGEKVGIVGRTGAGKTSLISILFRFFDFDGSVVIDNINTKTLPLNYLRSKISIIPQEPILFLGSLRKNIDPFDEYSDTQLCNALEKLNLKDMVANLPSGLESLVSERGSNFSVGQKQLLCMIRAILRQNKIIVFDEATANVDLQTDELIQNVIQKKFKNTTVLTIAHRLKTIINSDKILVMDNGQVVEFGQPDKLLQNTNGFFYALVQKSGGQMLAEFTKKKKKCVIVNV